MENPHTINLWADKTFGRLRSLPYGAARANVEMAELLREATNPTLNSRKTCLEAIDVIICLYRVVESCGYDTQQLIDEKMTINRSRSWIPDGLGFGQHIPVKET